MRSLQSLCANRLSPYPASRWNFQAWSLGQVFWMISCDPHRNMNYVALKWNEWKSYAMHGTPGRSWIRFLVTSLALFGIFGNAGENHKYYAPRRNYRSLRLEQKQENLSTSLHSYQMLHFNRFAVRLGSVVSLLVPCCRRRKNEWFCWPRFPFCLYPKFPNIRKIL